MPCVVGIHQPRQVVSMKSGLEGRNNEILTETREKMQESQ